MVLKIPWKATGLVFRQAKHPQDIKKTSPAALNLTFKTTMIKSAANWWNRNIFDAGDITSAAAQVACRPSVWRGRQWGHCGSGRQLDSSLPLSCFLSGQIQGRWGGKLRNRARECMYVCMYSWLAGKLGMFADALGVYVLRSDHVMMRCLITRTGGGVGWNVFT